MFKNREEAGRLLAEEILKIKNELKDPILLAIPRGGVVVAYEIAKVLRAPLDLVIPRKLGAPLNPELAIGAVAQDGSIYLDEKLIAQVGASTDYIQNEIKKQVKEIERRLKKYRGDISPPVLKNRSVVLVDDGIATGSTMRVAISYVKKQEPHSTIVAVPVAPPDSIEELRPEVDRIICLSTPSLFFAIGQFYYDFRQVSDEEVIRILAEAKKLLESSK